ncbi:MAG: hypothetical protein HND47_22265 [Chloroflexi bacterium]|nr:hypothetical protein [Chloroflexota bacterium]
MSETVKMIQLIIETRKIIARIVDESGGAEFERELPVFAWALYDDGNMEPLFIHKDFLFNSNPYGISAIKFVSRKDVDIVEYIWEQ